MSGWVELAVLVIAAWFIVATALALAVGPILRKHGRDPDRPLPQPCALCGTSRELDRDGICTDPVACLADLDAAVKTHRHGPECLPGDLP